MSSPGEKKHPDTSNGQTGGQDNSSSSFAPDASDSDHVSDEVTQEDELILEGIIGGAVGVVGDLQAALCSDISMSGPPEGSSSATAAVG